MALAVAALGACTGGGAGAGKASDEKAAPLEGDSTMSPAPPGKYRTLPQPCIAVDLDSLRQLVPGAADYSGTESLTYDTDRRVGCGWSATAADGTSRKLTIDFERVVSYDPTVSDEVEAETDFNDQASSASIPPLPPAGSTTTTSPPTTPAGGKDGSTVSTGPGSTKGVNGPSGGSPSGPDGSNPDYPPRHLTTVGNAAFINDVFHNPATGPHREVTLVFRTANVVVSVVYSQSSPRGKTPPQSVQLQEGAQKVAAQLERKIES